MIRLCNSFSISRSFPDSDSSNRPTGIPVHEDTRLAMSFSLTTSSFLLSPKRETFSSSNSASSLRRSVFISAAVSYSANWADASSWSCNSEIFLSRSCKLVGKLSMSILSLLAASSMKSTALSGSCLSTTYLLLNRAAASKAESSIVTL